jgi:Tol biopolymer transport system component
MAKTGIPSRGALLFAGLLFLPIFLYATLQATDSSSGAAFIPLTSSTEAPAHSGTTELISSSSTALSGYEESSAPVLSADGRFVAFVSSASLLSRDTNTCPGYDQPGSCPDVYVYDRHTGQIQLVSISSAGEQANGYSGSPAISADGRYVAFLSDASNLVSGDTNGKTDVFVHDLHRGQTERISISTRADQAGADSHPPLSISANGRFVAFSSSASNLVSADSNSARDVFVRDRLLRMTERVSISTTGRQGDGLSSQPSISSDGRFVAFTSQAASLAPVGAPFCAPQQPCLNVFVYDRQEKALELVSLSSNQEPGSLHSHSPSISADGRFIAFVSAAANLVEDDTNDRMDVFVRDRRLGLTERISVSSDQAQANWGSGSPVISADGWFVAFASQADNLVGGSPEQVPQVYLYDRLRGRTHQVSLSSTGVPGNWTSDAPSISASGRFIAFVSEASNLVSEDLNGVSSIFLRDRCSDGACTAATTVHSRFLPVVSLQP